MYANICEKMIKIRMDTEHNEETSTAAPALAYSLFYIMYGILFISKIACQK